MERDESKARGQRLREARQRAKLSVDQLAERVGYSPSGVRAIENGQNGMRPDAAEKFAPALGTTSAWLLTGSGKGEGAPYVRIIGRVGADAEGTVIQTGAQEAYDLAPVPPGGTSNSVALEVKGHSMRAIAEDGSLIYFEDQRNPPTPTCWGTT
jgi:transcriptional regulator with XRE-family HTH domain